MVVAPCLLQSLEESLASDAALVGGGATQTLRVGKQVGCKELMDGRADLGGQPLALKVVHIAVQILALLLEDDAVGVAIQLFV